MRAVLPKEDQSPRPALAGEVRRGAAHPPLRQRVRVTGPVTSESLPAYQTLQTEQV